MSAPSAEFHEPFRLHVGGVEARPSWKIFNIQAGPGIDFVGNCTDLSHFSNESVDEIYVSHVLEHLSHRNEISRALEEFHRVLKPTGVLSISVPDFDVLCRLFIEPNLPVEARFRIMLWVFGSHADPFDYHKIGLSWEILLGFLADAGFKSARRVQSFGLFNDCSTIKFCGKAISLNLQAYKSENPPGGSAAT